MDILVIAVDDIRKSRREDVMYFLKKNNIEYSDLDIFEKRISFKNKSIPGKAQDNPYEPTKKYDYIFIFSDEAFFIHNNRGTNIQSFSVRGFKPTMLSITKARLHSVNLSGSHSLLSLFGIGYTYIDGNEGGDNVVLLNSAGQSRHVCHLGDGDDTVISLSDDDVINAGAGDDVVMSFCFMPFSYSSTTHLRGGIGNDFILFSHKDDGLLRPVTVVLLEGGKGDDVIIPTWNLGLLRDIKNTSGSFFGMPSEDDTPTQSSPIIRNFNKALHQNYCSTQKYTKAPEASMIMRIQPGEGKDHIYLSSEPSRRSLGAVPYKTILYLSLKDDIVYFDDKNMQEDFNREITKAQKTGDSVTEFSYGMQGFMIRFEGNAKGARFQTRLYDCDDLTKKIKNKLALVGQFGR